MTHRQDVSRADVACGRDIAARWCALAEQRLEHLTEMFETGRWRRFHSELAFLENIQEAKRAVQAWRLIAAGEDVSVVASTGSLRGWAPATLSWNVRGREQAQTVQPKAVHIVPETSVAIELDTPLDVLAAIAEASVAPPTVPDLPQPDMAAEPATEAERVIEFTLSLDGIEAKYPLLRNEF